MQPSQESQPPKPASRWYLGVALGVVLALVVWSLTGRFQAHEHHPNAIPRTIAPRADLAADEQTTIELFRNASPSVAYITTLAYQRDAFNLNLFEIPQGTGSGFVWDQEGHIITNFHVIQEASGAKVTLADNSDWDAQLVGVAPDQDLAVLSIKAPAERLHPIPVGTSADLQVGQKVFAIGNPFGLDQTLTTGIISALGREIQARTGRDITGVIQTDAAINPGNSGGPLLDSASRLIGVNTAIFSPSGSSAGIGFAVPVDTVNRVVPRILRHGRVVRPSLGVRIADDAAAAQLGLSGVLIFDVTAGSAAARAGLRGTRRDVQGRLILGDVIVALDDNAIVSVNDLMTTLDAYKVGDQVTVAVRRDGKRLTVPITLEAVP